MDIWFDKYYLCDTVNATHRHIVRIVIDTPGVIKVFNVEIQGIDSLSANKAHVGQRDHQIRDSRCSQESELYNHSS